MKTKITFILSLILFTFTLQAQEEIEFTFANAEITNDGMDDFYEADVMIAAINGQADFKLGSGLLYINYNTAAFGSNISGSASAEITYTNPDYILGDVSGFPYYTSFNLADNSASRIAFSFQQGISSGSMTTENVTSVPKKLFHLKIKFVDSALDPMIAFEDNETQPPGVANCRDQFYSACGPSGSGFPDCGAEPGMQFLDAVFNSSGATLSIQNNQLLTNINVYPNPTTSKLYIDNLQKTELKSATIYDIVGKRVYNKTFSSFNSRQELNMSNLPNGIYLLKLEGPSSSITKKIIKR